MNDHEVLLMANALAKPDAPKKNQRYLLFYVCMMCIILFQHRTMADINSLSGNLYFDVDSNGTNEMILTRIGLGLGLGIGLVSALRFQCVGV